MKERVNWNDYRAAMDDLPISNDFEARVCAVASRVPAAAPPKRKQHAGWGGLGRSRAAFARAAVVAVACLALAGTAYATVSLDDLAAIAAGAGDEEAAVAFAEAFTEGNGVAVDETQRVGDFDFMPDGYLCDGKGNVVYGFLCIGTATQADVAAGKAKKEGDPLFSDQLVPLRKPRVWKDETGAMHIGYPRPGGGVQAESGTAGQADYVIGDPKEDDFNKKVTDSKGTTDDGHLLDYGAYKDAQGEVVESDYTFASFTNITVDNATGMITASCGDLGNQIVTIGWVAVGTVDNPNGVTQIGNSYFQAGQGSGNLVINTLGGAAKNMGINYVNGSLKADAGAGHKGSVNMAANDPNAVDGCRIRTGGSSGFISGGLEMSKSDLAQEIANMITTQRGYQANTRIITVTDSMLEELVNMKR